MLIFDHLVGYTYLGEVQKMRCHNVSSLPVLSGTELTATGLLAYKTASNDLFLHQGSNVWKRLTMEGDTLLSAKIPLTLDKIWLGDATNAPVETALSAIALSRFGSAAAPINMGGFRITNMADPVGVLDAANKQYVDSVAQGLTTKNSCDLASNQAIPIGTAYSNVSLTITSSTNVLLTATTIDTGAGSVTLAVGSRVLIKNEPISERNGIYTVTSLGVAGSAPWVLTRSLDANTNAELVSAFTFVEQGSSANTGFVQSSTDYDITNPTTKFITWTIFSSAGSYTAGRGLVMSSGTVFNFAKSTAYALGDTFYGIVSGSGDAAISKIQVLTIGSTGTISQSVGGVPVWSSWAMPTTNPASGSMLIGNAGGTAWIELVKTNSSILITDATGVPGWRTSLPAGTTLNGATIYVAGGTDVAMGDGGTGASLTANAGALVYSGASAMALSAVGTSGFFARSGGTGAPTFFDLFGTANTWTAAQSRVGADGTVAWGSSITGDVNHRLFVGCNGVLYWSPGSGGTYDCQLWRIGVGSMAFFNTLSLGPNAGIRSTLRFFDNDQSHYTELVAQADLTANKQWTLPINDGAGYFIKSDGAGHLSLSALSPTDIGSGAALSKGDDTNVTLTLTGTPGSALLAATTITAGWAGQLSVARGGTGLATVLTNAVLFGNGTGALQMATASANAVLATVAGVPTFTAQPTLGTGLITKGQLALEIDPYNTIAGSTGEIRFVELVANGTNYVGFKGPDLINTTRIWVLPAADGSANHVLKTDGAGNLAFAQITPSLITGGTALTTGTADANIGITLGGTPATSLLTAASITMSWTGTLATARGGLGAAPTVVQGGILYASSGSTFQCSIAGGAGQMLQSGASAPVTWSGYSMPTTMSGANYLFVSSSTTAVTTLAPVINSLLLTDNTGVVSWGGKINVARNTAGGVARKWCNLVAGDGANAYIVIAHNLNTRDVVASARMSNVGDTGVQEIAFSKITVEDANTIRLYFNAVQTASNFYVITVIG